MATALQLAAFVALLQWAVIAAPQALVRTDFGVGGKPFSDVNAASGKSITGALPEGWSDNTGWKSNVTATYRPMREGDRRFVRVTQTSGDGLQFTHGLPRIVKETDWYRLTLTARSAVGATVAVRLNGPPFATVWTVSPPMDGRWRNFSYDFRLTPQSADIGLYVYLSENGALDLQNLTLAKLSDQDLIAEIKAKYPAEARGNLVRQSRFPLGLQAGWSIGPDYSDGDQVQVSGDAETVGPSGSPALRIAAPTGVVIYSAPFPTPWSFEPHVASLFVRGEWDGSLVVAGAGGQACADLPLSVRGSGWQRVELEFKPILRARAHHLRIEGRGTLWIDGLQVERGAASSAFASRFAADVALTLAPSEAASARVIFEDEPMRIRYAVVGRRAGARLKARLVTMYGDRRPLPAVKLNASGAVSAGTWACSAFRRHPLGPYRLEAWVEDARGRRLSAENEVVFYRLHRPRYWGKDAPDSFFGTHTLSTNRHLTMAKAVGCNWVRLHDAGTAYIGWSFLEPEKGRWQFRDDDLARYRTHHLMILGLLSTTPGWASNWGKPCAGFFERYLEPVNMEDWANAVRRIVGRYRGVIDNYEVWNEPWGSFFWSWRYDATRGTDDRSHFVPSDTASADYARLQKVACAAAHQVDPAVSIVGFNTYVSEVGTKWTRDVLGFGGLDSCDAISYHHYETALVGTPCDAVERAYKAALSPIADKLGRVPKPVWMTEGAPRSEDTSNGFYRCVLPYENRDDNWRLSDRLARFLVACRAAGDRRAFLYTMHDHSTFGAPTDCSTLVTADGYLHPTAAALSALAWLLEDTRYTGRVRLAAGVYAYLFEGQGQAVAAVTSAPSHASLRLPAGKELWSLDLFGNPLAPDTAIDDRIHYVVCGAGLPGLREALVRR